MSDLTFILEFIASTTAIVLPIVLILRLLASDEHVTVSDLFIVAVRPVAGPLPIEEETPPRWRPELISVGRRAGEPTTGDRRAASRVAQIPA